MMHWCSIEGKSREYEAAKKTIIRKTNYESSAPSREQLLLSGVTHTTAHQWELIAQYRASTIKQAFPDGLSSA